MEKFAIRRTERFFAENGKLQLPAIELMYLWNTFKVLGKYFHLADNVLKIIEHALDDLDNKKSGTSKYEYDNRALLLLLKGSCLRQMKSPLQAIMYVVRLEKKGYKVKANLITGA